MIANVKKVKFSYKTSAWSGLYRYNGTTKPEEYNFKSNNWEETEDAIDAFYNPSTSDYSFLPSEDVEEFITNELKKRKSNE